MSKPNQAVEQKAKIYEVRIYIKDAVTPLTYFLQENALELRRRIICATRRDGHFEGDDVDGHWFCISQAYLALAEIVAEYTEAQFYAMRDRR